MRKLLALLVVLAGAIPLFGQGTSFPVFNRQGWTMAGAVVSVCNGPADPGAFIPCIGAQTTTYVDWTLTTTCTNMTTVPNPPGPPLGPTHGTGCTNPGLTDSHGNATIFAANGFYWAQVEGYQVVPQSFPFDIGSGGGGGGLTPCGQPTDIQNYFTNIALGCDTGIGILDPSQHLISENHLNANQQVSVGNGTANGLMCQGHSNGTAIDAAYCTQPSATFATTGLGYGLFPPDNQPTAVGNVVTVSSLTTTPIITSYGTIGFYPTHFVTAVSGLVSLENLPFIYTDIPCNSPTTCGDLAPIPVPYQANNFYAGPRAGTGQVGFLSNTVTAQDNTGTATHATFTFPYPTRTGDPLVLIINNNGGSPTTPTDTCGNTWAATANGHAWYVVSAVACAAPDTVTQSLGGTGGYIIGGGEVSGGGVLDTQASGGSCGSASGSTYPITFTSVTTTHIDTLVTLLVQGNTAQTGLGVYFGTNGLFLDTQASYDGGGGLGDSWSVAMAWQPALTPGSNNTTINYTYTGSSNICSAADAITLAFKPSTINNPANPTARDIYMDDLEQHILSAPSDAHGLVFDAAYGVYYNLAFGSGLAYTASTHTLSASGGGLPSGTGVVRVTSGTGSAAELSGDATTSGSNAVSVVKVNGGSVPASTPVVGTNSSHQFVAGTTVHSLNFAFGAPGGSALSTGVLGYMTIPIGCTLTGWDIAVDAGTATVKTLKVAAGTAIPTLGSNSISTSGVSISTGTVIQSTTLTDFTTTTFSANDIVAADLITTSGVGYIDFQLVMACAQ